MAKGRRSGKKTQGLKPIAEADKRQVLYDLGYVIDQLRGAYNLAFQNNPDQYAHNSFVESWLAHARALTEFFLGNKRNSVAVRDLVTSGYQTLSNAGAKLLFEHISIQMSHIQVRPSHDTDKIRPNSADMELLEAEIARFQNHLEPRYQSMLNLQSKPVQIVTIPTKASATSVVSSISSLPTGPASPPSSVKPSSWWGWLPRRR
jgi:hypothetical protein